MTTLAPFPPVRGGVPPFAPAARRRFALLLALAFAATAAFQGSRGLYESTETRYAECARETMASDDLDDPILYGQPHWTKPPLTYWAIGAGLFAFGNNAWGARAFLVLTFVGTVALVHFAGRSLWRDEDSAAAASLVYATSLFALAASNMVSTDSLLTFWIALGTLGFWQFMRSGHWFARLAFWLGFAAAFMTKGPPALLPLLGIFPAYFAMRRRDGTTPRLFEPLAVTAFLVVGFGWYVKETFEYPGLWRKWIVHETIGRNVSGEFNRNSQWYKGFLIYWPILLGSHMPWTLYLLAGRRRLGSGGTAGARLRLRGLPAERLYVILGVLLPLALFMLSTSRLALYVLPLCIPLSLAVGRGVALLVARGGLSLRTVRVTAVALFCVFVAAKAVIAYHPNNHDMKRFAQAVSDAAGVSGPARYYLVNHDPYPGLNFYLRSRVQVVVDPGETGDLTVSELPDRLAADAAQGIQAFVIVRRRAAGKVAPVLAPVAYELRPLDPEWYLLVPAPPLPTAAEPGPAVDNPAGK